MEAAKKTKTVPEKPPRSVKLKTSPMDAFHNIESVGDFTSQCRRIKEAKTLMTLTRQVGLLKICGCLEVLPEDKKMNPFVIPKGYVPLSGLVKVQCDAKGCAKRSMIKKHLNIELEIKNMDVSEGFTEAMTDKLKTKVAQNCQVSMCLFHFKTNFIRDCPPCAKKFHLIK